LPKSDALKGIAASPGLALGPARVLPAADVDVPRRTLTAGQVEAEQARFVRALETAQGELAELARQAGELEERETQAILEVQKLLLLDPSVLAETTRAIEDELVNAEFAFQRLFGRLAGAFETA